MALFMNEMAVVADSRPGKRDRLKERAIQARLNELEATGNRNIV